jgi:hypothetical protein
LFDRLLQELHMSVEMTYPHIEKTGTEPARLRRVPRVRISQIVMDYLAHGWSAEEMCRQHPYLMPSEAHAALTYYFDHQAEIDGEIASEWKEVEQSAGPRSPFFVRMRAKGAL